MDNKSSKNRTLREAAQALADRMPKGSHALNSFHAREQVLALRAALAAPSSDGPVVETKAPQVPAAHRAGTEPLSRLAGDVEWCLASINPDSDVYAVLHGVQVALRGHKTNGITIELKACDARRLLEDIKSDYPFKVGSQLAVLRDHLEASFAEKTSRQLAGSAADASGPVNQCTFPQETPANAMLKRVAQKPNGCRLCGHEHNLPPCPDETLDRSKPDLSQNGKA